MVYEGPSFIDSIFLAFILSFIGVFIRYYYYRKDMKAKHYNPKSFLKFYITRICIRKYIRHILSRYGNRYALKRVREESLRKSEYAASDIGLVLIRDSLKELMNPRWIGITPEPEWKLMYNRVLADLKQMDKPMP